MGVNFVITIENLVQKTQEEINKEFGVVESVIDKEPIPQWLLFDYEGKSYASWQFTPRHFMPEEDEKRWEALRKYLVKIREFLGGGEVMMSNDVVQFKLPPQDDDDKESFFLPWRLEEELLAEPNYKIHPELKGIKGLEGLVW